MVRSLSTDFSGHELRVVYIDWGGRIDLLNGDLVYHFIKGEYFADSRPVVRFAQVLLKVDCRFSISFHICILFI